MLKLESPILQAPMAGISTPAMAAAVSNAGGLGALGVGNTDAKGAAKLIAETRALTTKPFNVNLFCHAPAQADTAKQAAWIAKLKPELERVGAKVPTELREIYTSFLVDDAMLAMLIETKPAFVSFHFGMPAPAKVKALKDAGIILFATATSLAEAKQIRGVGAIVAQGYEAGGHRGSFNPDAPDDQLGTLALTRVLVRSLDIPVIAAGGIMDGQGIAATLKLGAIGAQLGTAFVGTPESAADEGYRAALFSDAAQHTRMTRAVSGRLARCIANKFTAMEDSHAPAYPIAYDLGKTLHQAAKAKGDFGYGAQWAGQGAPLARALPAGELVRVLAREITL
jgi:nitronate monooxygenase